MKRDKLKKRAIAQFELFSQAATNLRPDEVWLAAVKWQRDKDAKRLEQLLIQVSDSYGPKSMITALVQDCLDDIKEGER